jgi:hypothetical protein
MSTNIGRHSGAVRSTEPGIQKLRFDATAFRKSWIPGSGLRPAPE